jgi:hypothetical protein
MDTTLLHQAFRYGMRIRNEAQILEELQNVLKWTTEEVQK